MRAALTARWNMRSAILRHAPFMTKPSSGCGATRSSVSRWRWPCLSHLSGCGGADDPRRLRCASGSTFDQLNRALLVVDRDARVLSLNAVAEQLTGWNAQDAVGRPVYSVFHLRGEDREPPPTPAENALRDGREVRPVECVLRARDGRE